MTKHNISNTDGVIDSRDVIARVDELEELEAALTDAQKALEAERYDAKGFARDDNDDAIDAAQVATDAAEIDFGEDEAAELKALRGLAEEAGGSPDWTCGEMLIRDTYFEDYARGLADDIGAIPKDAGWPMSYIDWHAAAEALKQDYMACDFDGVEYLIRA